ncbi:MAG: hypothetical protein C4305_01405, partial [Thermoleophilia bacterium]
MGAVSSLAGLAPLLARACERPALTQPSRASLPLPLHGFLLQLPDFLLVAGLSALGTLAPVVLRHDFRLSPSLVAVA